MPFEVSQAGFSGPLHLLLELIEKDELPITEVSLAAVAEAYLKHIGNVKTPPEELADFLVVAAKLLLIKSRAILPVMPFDEPEEDGAKLATQLKLYREFAEASRGIETLWLADRRMFPRERATVPVSAAMFSPPPSVTGGSLEDAFRVLLKRMEPFFALAQTSMERVVSVQERIRDIRAAVLERARMSFRDVVRGAGSKVDVVVSFLALLELVKQRVVSVAQSDAFDDITIARAE